MGREHRKTPFLNIESGFFTERGVCELFHTKGVKQFIAVILFFMLNLMDRSKRYYFASIHLYRMLSFVLITVFVLFMCLSVNAQEEQGRAYYDLGIFAFEDEDYDAALENFKKALSFSSNDPYFNHYLGKTYMKMELYDEAKNHLDRAWEIDPGVEGLKYDYAFLNYKMSNYEKSADLFVEIVKEDPSNVLAQYHAGISLYEMKRYSDALNYFLNASEKSPTVKINGYYYAGICYRKMGKDKEAVEIFKYVRDNAESPSLKEYAVKWLHAIEEEKKVLKPYSLYMKMGYQYDDNVRLEPLENENLYADEADYAVVGFFSGRYNFVNKKTFKMGAGYSHYQTSHNELNEYDIVGSIGNIYVKYTLNLISLGLDYIPSQYLVNSEEYLRRDQLKPELAWKTSENLVTRLSYSYYINDNLQDDNSDGNTNDLFLDVYYGILKKRGNIFCGIGYESNDASHNDQDYTQLKTKLGLSLIKILWDINLIMTGKNYDKGYDNVDSIHEVKREDAKYGVSLSLSRILYRSWLSILLEYNYTNNESNIDDYTYKRSVTTLSLMASF